MQLIDLAEQRRLPDYLIRLGIRHLLKVRLRDEYADDVELQSQRYDQLLDELRQSPIAIETDAANQQHYEVPADFFRLSLGEHLKYSSCYWDKETQNLDQAEAHMLQLYVQRAELKDGQNILELGCGWGSLTLFMAKQLPNSRITGVSNSNSQRKYILQQAADRGLDNIEIITCDVNQLELKQQFDRIVSVEMFEHMRNYEYLLSHIANWLKQDGKLFVHIFCHRYLAYPFETEGDDNWMGRYFFTGGLMPGRDTLLHFQQHLDITAQWDVSGTHYQKTAEAWLQNTDQHEQAIIDLFTTSYGEQEAKLWLQRWRIFFMSCAELFGYRQGNEWLVAHYLFSKRNA
ncbi:MAG: class I SAM-dependent methyltransferase [Gammaproteobacteria bacterium]|jgi:cyclopropane-fatty-acyl-phospholipid synthase|nr:class I SAM-dependent methyltransferase [Gammaproteobacteria bacterium]MBT5221674.1 class I SAM-dependent methyltransferase [Gammaproteobacteria bacterium]MBT5826016.1 class I SAM-dependent methyltransferase [Gammaproteobacteria bacterium]MBT6420981.1 class I SAM-dependent methyltransferase [Gammaproteobacteria bacterium]MBT6576245.1 class I SAM-dependent methyltransferase [Gammaproteobacteria bacterium]